MEVKYWIAPISTNAYIKYETVIDVLLGQEKIFGISPKNHYRENIDVNDKICFYLRGYGIIADAKIISRPKAIKNDYLDTHFGLVIKLDEVRIYFQNAILITQKMRENLDAFVGNKISNWGWFVQTLHSLRKKDFELLTGKRQISS